MSRIRPLTARPFSSGGGSSNNGIGIGCFLHNPKLTSWNQHLSVGVGDYGGGKREMMMMKMKNSYRGGALVSSRWNPTPEQVQALEEMYRRGTTTPSAQQIQHITSKLRRFGKIEGKNVFYWFQNHKARDRQKKRRHLQLQLQLDPDRPGKKHHNISLSTINININNNNNALKHDHSGLSRKDMEIEHPKKLPTILSECNTSPKYLGGEVDECKRDGWTQLELQQQISVTTETSCRPSTSMDLSSNVAVHKIRGQENAHPFVALNLCKMKDDFEENRTLELFPVRSSGLSTLCFTKEEMDIDVSRLGTKLVPNQFFEFLPTKN